MFYVSSAHTWMACLASWNVRVLGFWPMSSFVISTASRTTQQTYIHNHVQALYENGILFHLSRTNILATTSV